jgi:ATP-dependent Clp protease ATP-binding subunit ClpC
MITLIQNIFLLGLVKEGQGGGDRRARQSGRQLDALKKSIEDAVTDSSGGMMLTEARSPRWQNRCGDGLPGSREMNTNYIGTEHLLLALAKKQNGIAAQILNVFGIDYKSVREEVLASFPATGSHTPSKNDRRKERSSLP